MQQAGFRLQKLRAALFLLHATEKNQSVLVYAAIEAEEDVNTVESNSQATTQVLEQAKAYSPESSFSYQNIQVLKALANFLTCWASRNFSFQVTFAFYATNAIAKENTSERSKRLNIDFPETPLIESLQQAKFDEPKLLNITSTILLDYLTSEKCLEKSLQESVEKWTEQQWQEFFERIDWKFGQQDVVQLKAVLLKSISNSPLYRGRSYEGREELIASRLVDLFDERQSNAVLSERFVYGGDVKNIFLEVSTGAAKVDDHTWQMWQSLTTSDQRGLSQKIRAVCTSISSTKINSLSRKVSAGILFHKSAQQDKRVLSVRYRVYDICKDLLDAFIAENAGKELTEDGLDQQIGRLIEAASSSLTTLSNEYQYPATSKEVVTEIMLELIDSCFLAFDISDEAAND